MIKYSLVRLSIILILVLLFPLVQKQWLNLYLFDINNFTIYKLLYFLSGLVCPILIIINSLNKFTYYKFNNKLNYTNYISGKSLLLIVSTVLIILSILISDYLLINLTILLNLIFNDNKFLVHFDIYKQILFLVIISILLLFNKIKFIIKKVTLINFFMMAIIIWYSEINNTILNNTMLNNIIQNNSILNNIILFDILKFENINFVNLLIFLSIEIFYYLWSYISYSSYLSDWKLPSLYKKQVSSLLNIIVFYLFIILYYSILYK